jgi:signal transduction histidine kinase
MKNVELMENLGHLASAVGHQVINSFSTIVSQGEILRMLLETEQVSLSGDFRERIETIIRTSLEASVLTRKLIEVAHDLTSIDSVGALEPLEEILLDQMLADYVRGERDRGIMGVDWLTDLSPVRPIHGQVAPLRIMLSLLTQNALESFTTGTGTIRISTRMGPRGWVQLEIQDNGCGMTTEVLEHAVAPFFTTKPDRRGIGLTIARGIWRRHRGTLAIDSQPGQGTTLRLSTATMEG